MDNQLIEKLRSDNIFIQAMDSSISAIAITSLSGEIIYSNNTFNNLFPAKEVFNNNLLKLIYEDENITELETSVQNENKEIKLNINNAVFHLDLTSSFILNNEEKTGILFSINDISKRKKLESKLKKKNYRIEDLKHRDKMKTEFLSYASHDIRSPLAIIRSHAEFLYEISNKNLTDLQKSSLQKIIQKSSYINDIVENFLDITSIENNELKLNLDLYNYTGFIKNTISSWQIIAIEKNISINLKIHSKLPKVLFDRNRIEQVLNNLISNAIKYSKKDSKVNVIVSLKGNYIITKVRDFGKGIPKKDLNNIFNKYFKSKIKPVKKEKRTGIGLAIAEKLVKEHCGKIGVFSKLGEGSCFYYILPINV